MGRLRSEQSKGTECIRSCRWLSGCLIENVYVTGLNRPGFTARGTSAIFCTYCLNQLHGSSEAQWYSEGGFITLDAINRYNPMNGVNLLIYFLVIYNVADVCCFSVEHFSPFLHTHTHMYNKVLGAGAMRFIQPCNFKQVFFPSAF